MTKKHPRRFLSTRLVRSIALGTLCIIGSFALGIETTKEHLDTALRADVSQADGPVGDVNGDGTVDIKDVILILEFEQGLSTPTTDQRKLADVDHDYRITVQDALRIARAIALR
ncbi:hypothetical protein HY285_05530 [Candidatus Peregrinibacteria bacterium]|nr:hypothetical protein [Candidatus Peregrinibacteria bacterium]MBI3816969.1 hypothetical protein [Candidatus Peregrinibacteria bacterium]